MWLESRDERDSRFPELAGLEPATVAMCAVPLRSRARGWARCDSASPAAAVRRRRTAIRSRPCRADARRHWTGPSSKMSASRSPSAPAQPAASGRYRRFPASKWPRSTTPSAKGWKSAATSTTCGRSRPGNWALAIGDVAGTGPESAAVTAQVRYTLRALTLSERDPAAGTVDRERGAPARKRQRGRRRALLQRHPRHDRSQWRPGAHRRQRRPPLSDPPLGRWQDPGVARRRHAAGRRCQCADRYPRARARAGRHAGVVHRRPIGGPPARTASSSTWTAHVGWSSDAPIGASQTALALEQAVLQHTAGQLNDDVAILVVHAPDIAG